MENNSQELEIKTSNKDMWLFLIVLDVVFLCVFGFFLYKHFAVRVENPAPVSEPVVMQEETVEALPEMGEEVVTVTQTTVEEAIPASVQEEVVAETPVTSPVVQEPSVVQETSVEKEIASKKSIVIAPASGNSKYRRVTFKWFEPANTVSIVSGFTNRKPQALKKVGDHWETTLSIATGTYKFLYIVDGKNTVDPYADQKDGRSVLIVK